MQTPAYPLRFQPAFRDYLWGGRKLATRLGKQLPSHGVWAESWELVDHPEHESTIQNGPLAGRTLGELMRSHAQWLVGDAAAVAGRFPLLLKYLDCNRALSVQVHPDDEYALKMNPPDLGKTEAWYIVDAEPGSTLYAGLKSGIDHRTLAEAIAAGKTAECLHQISPAPGDCVFIPAGTVHALGAGLIVAEIQQSSNTTFRLYDWDRVDDRGQPRALHVSQSLAVIDYSAGPKYPQKSVSLPAEGHKRLVECEKFCLNQISDVHSTAIGGDGRCHILTVPLGSATVLHADGEETLATGESALVPAACGSVRVMLSPSAVVLEATT